MGDFRKYLEKQMEDVEFRKEWQESETESHLRSIKKGRQPFLFILIYIQPPIL